MLTRRTATKVEEAKLNRGRNHALLLKSMPRKQLVELIRKVHAGKRYIPPEVLAHLAEHLGHEALSRREIEVLQLLGT